MDAARENFSPRGSQTEAPLKHRGFGVWKRKLIDAPRRRRLGKKID
jgi:hypothetical protein